MANPRASSSQPGRTVVLLLVGAMGLLAALATRIVAGDANLPPPTVPVSSQTPVPQASAARNDEAANTAAVPFAAQAPHADRCAVAVRGRVVDLAGSGVANVRIGQARECSHDGAPAPNPATSTIDGSFVLPEVAAGSQLLAIDPQWQTVQSARVVPGSAVMLVIAPRIEVAGTVLDAIGMPVAGAWLAIVMPTAGTTASEAAVQHAWSALSDSDGTFVFQHAPAVAGARLLTWHPGKLADERVLPIGSPHGIVVQLRDEPTREPVRGTVYGPDGSPVANAMVRVGAAHTQSCADGAFVLAVANVPPPNADLFVLATGFAPARVAEWRGPDGRPRSHLTVQLGQPVSIRGRVVDANARPLADWHVMLTDATAFDSGDATDAHVEGHLGATRTVTDAAGRFVFTGVFDRTYVVEAFTFVGDSGLRATVSPADGDVTLTSPARMATTLRGVVLDGDDRPVVGAIVGEQRAGCPAPPGTNGMRFDMRVTTGNDGRFDLPIRGAALHLLVDGREIVPARIPLLAPLTGLPLKLRVARRRVVHVEIDGGSLQDIEFTTAAADGRALDARSQDGAVASIDLGANAAAAFGVDQSARMFVLRQRGVVLAQLPVSGSAAELNLRVFGANRSAAGRN